jgi:hypothetical protein
MIAAVCWADPTALRGIRVPDLDAREGLDRLNLGDGHMTVFLVSYLRLDHSL